MAVTATPASGGTARASKGGNGKGKGPEAKAAEKPEKPKRVAYGERFPDDHAEEKERGELKTKLTAIPSDFDAKKHLPLTAKDFSDKAVYYDMRAAHLSAAAEKMTKLAAQERAMGSAGERAEKKRLLSLTEKVATIKSNLMAGGMTEEAIQALIASVVAKAPATPAT